MTLLKKKIISLRTSHCNNLKGIDTYTSPHFKFLYETTP